MLSGCATYNLKYRDTYKPLPTPEHNRIFTFYFIGDAGNASMDKTLPALEHLEKELKGKDSTHCVIWLGDNIYPDGIPPTEDSGFELAMHRMRVQMQTVENFHGHCIFLPGNHDWYVYGREGIIRQETLLDTTLSRWSLANDNYFMPDDGCGDPQVVELTEEINILVMDSHWFIKRSQGHAGCEVKSQAEFLVAIEEALSLYKDETLLIALHHPPYTYGHHGGKYTIQHVLFPFTMRYHNLYIPLPILGYGVNKAKNYISDQDLSNRHYRYFSSNLLDIISKYGTYVVAAGHEHNLQHIERGGHYFIVSGSGSKRNPCSLGKGSKFCAGEPGYVKLDIYENDISRVQYIVPGRIKDVAYETEVNLKSVE